MWKVLKKHIIVFMIITVFYIVCITYGFKCPIKYITGVSCPTCGMSRAMWALLRLDIAGYVEYNVMAFFMFSAVLIYIHKNVLKKKRWISWYMIIVLSVNTIVYIMEFV